MALSRSVENTQSIPPPLPAIIAEQLFFKNASHKDVLCSAIKRLKYAFQAWSVFVSFITYVDPETLGNELLLYAKDSSGSPS